MAKATFSDSTLQLVALVGKIACIIFLLEAAIMLAFAELQIQLEGIKTSLLDAGLLTVLASPLIYFWVARPFANDASAARHELGVQLYESNKLLDQNEALRLALQELSEINANVHERVLQRVGADLHDGPAQALTFTLVQLDRLSRGLDQDPVRMRELKEAREVIADAIKEIKTISRGLIPPELGSLTLAEVVDLAVQRHRQATGAEVTVEVDGIGGATLMQRASIYRVVQEALANAHKHGKAQRVAIRVEHEPCLTVTIADDGQGFNPSDIDNGGLGLSGMRARVQSLGGQFGIKTRKGEGTKITLRYDRPLAKTSGPHA